MPMLLIAAAALAATPPPTPVRSVAQATATIRIVRAVELKFDGTPNEGAPPARDSQLRAVDGSAQHAKLIEFQ